MNVTTKYRTCNLCEALCGLEITLEEDRILSIKGDKKDVFSKGHICPKAVALKDIHTDPDRLKFPMKKINGQWRRISWDEAILETAENLVRIQKEHGDNAVGVYQGNPSIHNLGTSLFSPGFVRALKTKNRFSATSVDQLAHHMASEFMFGHMNLLPVPDIDRTDFWLIIGGNPLVSNGSLMTAPNIGGRLKDIQSRGGEVVVIDPRRTETARKADQHIPINPGSDVFLLLCMIHRVFYTGRLRLGHLKEYISTEEINGIRELVTRFTPAEIEPLTGIPAEVIIELTDRFLAVDKAVCYGRLGVSAAQHGGLCLWAINTLNIITGNFDTPGGAMFANPAIGIIRGKNGAHRFGRWKSRVRGMPEAGGELSSSVMAEEILTPGEGQIRGFITSCGNPILSTPNGRQLDTALSKLEFMVSIDIYINETTRHAHIILPPATGLETPHYSLAFQNLSVRNHTRYSPPVIAKEEGMRYDWEIFRELHQTYIGLKSPGSEEDMYFHMTPSFMLEQGLKSGPYDITLETVIQATHGIDLGPLTCAFPERLRTENQQIHLLPDIIRNHLLQLKTDKPSNGKIRLIGRRDLRSNNSWMHNSQRLVKGKNRCTAILHPADAEKLGIGQGQRIVIQSRVGQASIEAELSESIMPGVISIPHGWGHDREGVHLKTAQAHAGISMNDLVDDQETDPLTGAAVINGIPVDIFKAETSSAPRGISNQQTL